MQVDLSGPVADSEYLPELAETVAHFAQDLNDRQEVAVNAFDGNDEVAPFLAFGAGKEQFRKLADGLRQVPPAQPQLEPVRRRLPGNLGAWREGRDGGAEKQATLIVFTDRADLSHTVGMEQMKEKLKATPVQVYIIGVGEQINRQELTMLARAGTYLSNDPGVQEGLRGDQPEAGQPADGRYVLSYCSTKRKGSHKLEIEVETPKEEEKSRTSSTPPASRPGARPRSRSTWPRRPPTRRTKAATTSAKTRADAAEPGTPRDTSSKRKAAAIDARPTNAPQATEPTPSRARRADAADSGV